MYENQNHGIYNDGANYGSRYRPYGALPPSDPFSEGPNDQQRPNAFNFDDNGPGQPDGPPLEPVGWQPNKGWHGQSPDNWVGSWVDSTYSNQASATDDRYNYNKHEKPRLRDRITRRMIGVTALIGVGLAGVTAGGVAAHEAWSNSGQASHSAEAGDGVSLEAVPDEVRQDIEEALAVDTCPIEVTTEEVVDVYQRLFEVQEPGDKSIDQLTDEVQEAGDRLADAREQQGFVPLPESFDRLRSDALGEQAIPLEEYKREATDYLNQLGVDTVLFGWAESSIATGSDDPVMNGLSRAARPVTNDPDSMREALVSVMIGYSNLSPHLIDFEASPGAQHRRIVAFGELRDRSGALASTLADQGLIVYDIKALANSDVLPPEVAPTHEDIHEKLVCGAATSFLGGDSDPAFDSLGNNFPDTEENIDTLSRGESVEHDGVKYSVTGNSADGPNEVNIAPRPYGVYDSEGPAVLIGENVLFAPGNVEFLGEDDASNKINYERTALWLARLAHDNPELISLVEAQFAAARLVHEIDAASKPINDGIEAELVENFDKHGSASGGEVVNPELERLQAQEIQLSDLRQQLLRQIDPSTAQSAGR